MGAPAFVRGRLRNCAKFWRSLAVPLSLVVLAWITDGYPLEWDAVGENEIRSWELPNHKSCFEHDGFVTEAIMALILCGAARKVSFRPDGVSPLGVAVHSRTSKKRLIFDLRSLNKFLTKRKFKYEGVHSVMATAKPGDCAFSFDLKAAYHHVGLATRAWRWFGFAWKGQFYEFCSLPFGLAPACRTFTYITRGLAAHWRAQCIRMVHYIDDWVFFCSPEEHAELVARILADIEASGFIINEVKTHGTDKPTFQFDWIGYTFDLVSGTYGVLAYHMSHVKQMCEALLALPVGSRVKAVQIMQLTGKLASAHRLLGSALRMFTFHLNSLAHSVRRKTFLNPKHYSLAPNAARE